MRVPVICFAVIATVILALPETAGAPTFADTQSYKREEENSKKVAKEGEEQEQYYESSNNSDGLVSGTQVHSQEKRNSELEEQQSRSSEEIKTANGLKKTHKSKKQKKVVTSKEHKTVLVYYMVSYKTLPKQRSGEDRVVYYKRVFPVEDNLKQFYHKIFKNYESEESKEYIERVEFILNNVYPEYDPRLDVKWLEEFDHYYTLKYSRKTDECDDSYFPRILAKESGESSEHYKKRMECLIAALDEEDFTHITFDDSELGYKIGVRSATARTSTGSTEGDYDSEINTSTQKSRAEEESVDEDETTVEREGATGKSSAHKKQVKKKRTTVEKEVQSKSSTFRMAYNKLPARESSESLVDYYKKYFGEYTLSEMSEEAKDEFYLRLLIQYRGESVEDYIKRVDYLFNEVYTDFDIRTDATFANLLTHYYRSKYDRTSTETVEQWYTRVLKKQDGETAEQYKQRISCLQAALTEIDWSEINIDENSTEGYTIVSRGSSSNTGKSRRKEHCKNRRKIEKQKRHERNLKRREEKRARHEENVKEVKRRRRGHKDNVDKYNKREKEHRQNVEQVDRRRREHNENVREVERKNNEHDKNVKEVDRKRRKHDENVKEIDTRREEHDKNVQKINERNNQHDENAREMERRKKEHEKNVNEIDKRKEEHDKNVRNINEKNNQHDENVREIERRKNEHEENVKKWIKANYRRKSGEDLSEYYKRVCTNNVKGDEEYIERMTYVRSLFPDLDLWYDEKYLSETRFYYTLIYTQKETETEEEYYKRLLTREWYESEDNFAKRVNVLHSLFPSLPVWHNKEYYDKFTKTFYETFYKKKETETVEAYLNRICTKSGSETEEDFWKRVLLIQETFPDYEYWNKKQYLDKLNIYDIISRAKSELELEELISKDESSEDEQLLKVKLQCLKRSFDSINTRSEEYNQRSLSTTSTEEEIKKTYFKSDSEDVTTYVTRLTNELAKIQTSSDYINIVTTLHKQYPELPLWYDTQYFDLIKNYYTSLYEKNSVETEEDYFKRIVTKEDFETDEYYVKRIEVLQKLYPTLTLWSNDDYYEKYLKSYYSTFYKKLSDEDDDTYYTRIISKSDEESDFAFITRLNLIKKAYPELPLWYDTQYSNLVKEYYTTLYEKKTDELEEDYYKRVLVKQPYETDETFYKRLLVLQNLYPTLSVWYSDKYYTTYSKAFYESIFNKLSTEDEDSYFSRIISQFDDESDTTYVERLHLIKRTYPELDLWYNTKYIDLVKKYYVTYYTKTSTETEEDYVKRVLTKESCESNELYTKRIQILQSIFPTLSIWSDEQYYKTYIKECYQILYKQQENEDKDAYFSRVVSKLEGEDDLTYVSRLALIQRTYRCLPLWYNEKYYDLVKEYYTFKYAQLDGESEEVYIKRLVAKEKGDSTDSIYGKRIHLIYLATINSPEWYEDKYYEFTKSYYESYYTKDDKESCADWLKRVITVLPGESECNAIKRITLVKKSTDYSCWTQEILSQIESDFSQSYITLIKENFFVTVGSYSSSSSTSSKSSSSSEESEEEFTQVSRG